MILDLPCEFPPDACERRLPDVAAARALLGVHAAPLEALFARRRRSWVAVLATPEDRALLARSEDALRLAYARLALRHGHLGTDLHAYHNEGHILDICGERVERLGEAHGLALLPLRSWCALLLFGAGHDLRQREAPGLVDGVGANERASIAETWRILDVTGFSRERDADLYAALELMIAGSTFDARPSDGHAHTAADFVRSGGALAARLGRILDVRRPGWRDDAGLVRAQQLALVAADLDTANVAAPFARFAATAENLCRARERLHGRALDGAARARPGLAVRTDDQERFFFELHRFQSDAGRVAFAAGKNANAGPLRALGSGLRARIAAQGAPRSGDEVIAAYRAVLAELLAAA